MDEKQIDALVTPYYDAWQEAEQAVKDLDHRARDSRGRVPGSWAAQMDAKTALDRYREALVMADVARRQGLPAGHPAWPRPIDA